jgi:hypothetical protein
MTLNHVLTGFYYSIMMSLNSIKFQLTTSKILAARLRFFTRKIVDRFDESGPLVKADKIGN